MVFPENSFIISVATYRIKSLEKSPMGLISMFQSGSKPGDLDYIQIKFGDEKFQIYSYIQIFVALFCIILVVVKKVL